MSNILEHIPTSHNVRHLIYYYIQLHCSIFIPKSKYLK